MHKFSWVGVKLKIGVEILNSESYFGSLKLAKLLFSNYVQILSITKKNELVIFF